MLIFYSLQNAKIHWIATRLCISNCMSPLKDFSVVVLNWQWIYLGFFWFILFLTLLSALYLPSEFSSITSKSWFHSQKEQHLCVDIHLTQRTANEKEKVSSQLANDKNLLIHINYEQWSAQINKRDFEIPQEKICHFGSLDNDRFKYSINTAIM